MKIVIAPDSYKGSLSALGVAEAIERGVRSVFPDAAVEKVPIADGGEGTVDALVVATKGRIEERTVRGPLGEPVRARWGVLGDGETGVIEMAAASGLPLVAKERRDPRATTTYGTGELVRAALDAGMGKVASCPRAARRWRASRASTSRASTRASPPRRWWSPATWTTRSPARAVHR